jgi:hypothetical protein
MTHVIFVRDELNPSHRSGWDINPCPSYAYLALLLLRLTKTLLQRIEKLT